MGSYLAAIATALLSLLLLHRRATASNSPPFYDRVGFHFLTTEALLILLTSILPWNPPKKTDQFNLQQLQLSLPIATRQRHFHFI